MILNLECLSRRVTFTVCDKCRAANLGAAGTDAAPGISKQHVGQCFVELVAALRQGLAEGGYTEGLNIAVEYRWAENRDERLPALAADARSPSVRSNRWLFTLRSLHSGAPSLSGNSDCAGGS